MRALIVKLLRRFLGPTADEIAGDADEARWSTTKLAAVGVGAAARRARLPRCAGAMNDLRHAVRSLRSSPWYATTIIAVLGLTGALATAAFAIVDGVLFKPLPYPKANQLFTASGPASAALSIADLNQYRRAVPDAAFAMYQRTFAMGAVGTDRPTPVRGAGVGPGFFDVLGQHPLAGGFVAADFEPSDARLRVLISFGLWQQHFGGQFDAIGKPFVVAGAADHLQRPLPPLVVAGVLPEDFVYPFNRGTPDLLIPIAVPPAEISSRNATAAVALIRTTIPLAEMGQRLTVASGSTDPKRRVAVLSVPEILLLFQKDSLRTSFLASAILMLLAMLNVAALTVVKGRQRAHELVLRRALGAGRADLFRLAIVEAAPLAALGGIAAIVIAPSMIALAAALMPANFVLLKVPRIDWRVGLFTASLAGLAMCMSALARVWFVSTRGVELAGRRHDLPAPHTRRFGAVTVAVQVALAFAIAVAGTLVVGSLWRLWREPIGFPLERRVLIELSHGSGPAADRAVRLASLIAKSRAVPGVERVAAIGGFFLQQTSIHPPLILPPDAKEGDEGLMQVSGDFFALMNLRPTAGRLPTAEELDTFAPVAVISESVAPRWFPGKAAVGQTLTTRGALYSVIGVVPDVQMVGLGSRLSGQVYWPDRGTFQRPILLIEGDASLRSVLALIASEPSLGVMRAMTFTEAVGSTQKLRVFRAWLFGALACAALVIVGVGTFGMIAMSVAARTRELGIRSALGASRESLVALFVREQLLTVGAGLAGGALLAVWSSRLIKAYLFEVTPGDPRMWAIAASLLIVVAGVAALIPALRASRIDPVKALRVD
jgi:putative ABC transport system permease protein